MSLLLTLGLVAGLAAGCSSKTDTSKSTTVSVDGATVKMGRATYAAHGTKAFADVVVAMAGDKIIGVSLDEYQFMDKSAVKGVPNSDKDFGQNYKDPNMVLASKSENADYYSANMKKEAQATTPWDKSIASIEKYATGKTVAELEDELSKKDDKQMVDAVSGATLQNTKGYVSAIVAAAKNAK